MRRMLGTWRRELEQAERGLREQEEDRKSVEKQAHELAEALRARVQAGARAREQAERRVRSLETALESLRDETRSDTVRRLEARLRDARARGKLRGASDGRTDLEAAQAECGAGVREAQAHEVQRVRGARDGVESEMRQHLEPALRAEREEVEAAAGRRVALEARLQAAHGLLSREQSGLARERGLLA